MRIDLAERVASEVEKLGREALPVVLNDPYIIDKKQIHEAVGFLIEHLPQQMHLIVASRAEPPVRDLSHAVLHSVRASARRACGELLADRQQIRYRTGRFAKDGDTACLSCFEEGPVQTNAP